MLTVTVHYLNWFLPSAGPRASVCTSFCLTAERRAVQETSHHQSIPETRGETSVQKAVDENIFSGKAAGAGKKDQIQK